MQINSLNQQSFEARVSQRFVEAGNSYHDRNSTVTRARKFRKQVRDVDQLVRDVGDLTVGESAVFDVIRDGKKLSLTCVIESRTDEVINDSSKQWPGFVALPLTEDIEKELGISNKNIKGVVVSNVQAKSPAAALSLQSGDIITAVNDTEITGIEDFYSVLATEATKEVWYDIYRNGMKMSTLKYKF